MVRSDGGACPRRSDGRLDDRRLAPAVAVVLTLLVLGGGAAARAWRPARIEPKVDNLEELVGRCHQRRAEVRERNRDIDAWVAYQAAHGEDVSRQFTKAAEPACDAGAIGARLGATAPAVWAMAAGDGARLYATVNLPLPGLLVSADGGRSWHYRHLFLGGLNADRGFLLRGLDYRDGLLAIASDSGVLLSADRGRTFTTALAHLPFSAVAIAAGAPRHIAAGGNGTSFLSTDGGATWNDLAFSRFTAALTSRNPYRIDHVTSIAFDPTDPGTVYFGTGSQLYRFLASEAAGTAGKWQAMEGDARGRVLDDSTVYNIEIGARFMISTCNGVYYLDRLGDDVSRDQADVSWGKFRDGAFCARGVGGPKGNLRAYFVAEDPDDPERVLVADFAGLYEGRSDGRKMRWKRIEELPYGSVVGGYPEYTSIAWSRDGETVVGSRYRGIFVDDETPRPPVDPGPSCVLR